MSSITTTATGYQVRVSTSAADPDWDQFLESVPGGHHTQTSLWAQVKAFLGWRSARVVVTDGGRIVAGCQMMFRRMRLLGSVAYVPKGPVLASDDPRLLELTFRQLRDVAKSHGARAVLLQPPNCGTQFEQELSGWGFHFSPIETGPNATTLVDLSPSTDDILARMRKGTRKNIRRSERDGISVREGTEADLTTFHRLMVMNSKRRGFAPFSVEYVRSMWRILYPHGYLQLFLSELDGEPVSAQLILPFGDTAFAKQVGWSGDHGRSGPNEALDWATIKWAKSHGCRYYDLEGIDPAAVKALQQGQQLPDALRQTPTFYKLGLGGEAMLLPETYGYIFNPVLRAAHRNSVHLLSKPLLTEKHLSYFRTKRTSATRSNDTK